jgi:KUP system potassium uptake protein
MREVWHWNLALCAAIGGALLCVDVSFVSANLVKVLEGGWVPLVLATLVYIVLVTWHRGSQAISDRLRHQTEPAEKFLARIQAAGVPRVPGTAVFLTRTWSGVPPVMVWHVKHNRALHQYLVVVTVVTTSTPWVKPDERLTVENLGPCFWRATAHFGFMERPDIPRLLRQAHKIGCGVDLNDVTYYVGHETVLHRAHGRALPVWQERLFAAMQRNSTHVSDFFRLPHDSVVEIGRQIAI